MRGTSGGGSPSLQTQAVVVKPPPEGVVRRSYLTALQTGPAVLQLPATATEAWAHFQLAAQPIGSLPLTVTWYYPDGRVLGSAAKPNREDVTSFIRSRSPVPRGTWVAELKAGTVTVQRLSVRVGV